MGQASGELLTCALTVQSGQKLEYNEPHTNQYYELYLCMYYVCIIGASLSEPHIDETNARNPYNMFMFIYVWYVRHARTAIDIVQRCAVYFKRPHENICVSIVTCFFDTLNYFKGHFIYDYTCSLLLF